MKVKYAVIADGNSMGVSAQVLEDPLGPVKGWFAIDNPFLMIELSSKGLKGTRVLEMTDTAGEDKLFILKTPSEMVKELAPEQRRHHPDREEESLAAGDPAFVGGQASPGDDTVQMGVLCEVPNYVKLTSLYARFGRIMRFLSAIHFT